MQRYNCHRLVNQVAMANGDIPTVTATAVYAAATGEATEGPHQKAAAATRSPGYVLVKARQLAIINQSLTAFFSRVGVSQSRPSSGVALWNDLKDHATASITGRGPSSGSGRAKKCVAFDAD
jgi:hypothetical protein